MQNPSSSNHGGGFSSHGGAQRLHNTNTAKTNL